MNDLAKDRIASEIILRSKEKSDDLKLYEVFQIYKDELKNEYSQLYYALLGWKDNHLRELQIEQSHRKGL